MSLPRISTSFRAFAPASLRQRIAYPVVVRQARFYAEDKKSTKDTVESNNGPKPKILETAPPAEETEDVKQHNKEFEKRTDRTDNRIDPEGKMYRCELSPCFLH